MIYKSFKETELFQGETNKTYEYNINDKDINYCIAEINGRFPTEKRAVNRKCKEMAHILKGSGRIVVEGIEYLVKEDDVVLIYPNERYYWEGNLKLGIPCSPAWTHEQHEIVD